MLIWRSEKEITHSSCANLFAPIWVQRQAPWPSGHYMPSLMLGFDVQSLYLFGSCGHVDAPALLETRGFPEVKRAGR